jgi:hypothetical protein
MEKTELIEHLQRTKARLLLAGEKTIAEVFEELLARLNDNQACQNTPG